MPPESCWGGRVALVPQPQVFKQLLGARHDFGARHAVVAGLREDDVDDLFENVEIKLLRHDADVRFSARRFGVDRGVEDYCLARCFVD